MSLLKRFFHEPPEGQWEEEFAGLTMANDASYAGFQAVAKTGKILAIHAENNDIITAKIKELRAAGNGLKGRDHAPFPAAGE